MYDIYHIFFIRSTVDGHSGCFHVLALINRAAMNTGMRIFSSYHFLPLYAQKWDFRVIW